MWVRVPLPALAFTGGAERAYRYCYWTSGPAGWTERGAQGPVTSATRQPMKLILTAFIAALAGGALVWWLRDDASAPQRDAARVAVPAASASPGAGNSGAEVPKDKGGAKPHAPSAADLAAKALEGEVVVSLGKVEDIGRQAAGVMLAKKELKGLKGIQIPERTPEQRRRILELERQRAELLGSLPEVAGFQNNPDEYARFFTGMLKEAAALDAAQSKAVNDYMLARGQAMINAGLNDAKKPADPAEFDAWEVRRDAFNADTVAGVGALLPPGTADRVGFNNAFMELLERDFDRAEE